MYVNKYLYIYTYTHIYASSICSKDDSSAENC